MLQPCSNRSFINGIGRLVSTLTINLSIQRNRSSLGMSSYRVLCPMWESLAKRWWEQRHRLDRYSSRSDWGHWHWTSILWAIQQSSTTTSRSYWRAKIELWRDRAHVRWWKDCSEAKSSNHPTQVPEDNGSTSEQRTEQWRDKRNPSIREEWNFKSKLISRGEWTSKSSFHLSAWSTITCAATETIEEIVPDEDATGFDQNTIARRFLDLPETRMEKLSVENLGWR